MATRQRIQFIHGVTGWMLATVVALVVFGSLTVDLFFIVSLVGFLVVIELTTPMNVTPTWRARLKWLIVVGLAVFAYIVLRRIIDILPQSIVEQLPFVAWVI